jgi:Zn-dependent metalloprotease
MCMHCRIVPLEVLKRLAEDTSLSSTERKSFADSVVFDTQMRKVRNEARILTRAAFSLTPSLLPMAASPTFTVYNCGNTQNLPGTPVANPGSSADPTIKRAFATSRDVASFYAKAFGRNSIDNLGMALLSSVHYGIKYNNAFWNGSQMTYGDGDGQIFVDFTSSNDVICHELTHGVTQFTLNLAYANEPGGLNESMSDVFGSMFRQWSANQDVVQADWLIGKDIMGPKAVAKGYTCLRDMATPDAQHCLAPQPKHYAQYHSGMDPHSSSGIPNRAFFIAAKAVGGKSWEKIGKVWYNVLSGSGSSPNMRMKTFANRTRKVAKTTYPAPSTVYAAVDDAWKQVGL